MNVQFALQGRRNLHTEVNPRASRTVPLSPRRPAGRWPSWRRASWRARPWELGIVSEIEPRARVCQGSGPSPLSSSLAWITILGPEMKSTGEVMGIDCDFARAFARPNLPRVLKLPMSRRRFHKRPRQRQKHIVSQAKTLYDETASNW